MRQVDGSLKFDGELVGVIAAIWQWGHFTNQVIGDLTVHSRRPNMIRVNVEVSQPAIMGRSFPYLSVNYAGGEVKDDEGNIWYFIIGDNGLEFRKG